VDLAGGPGQGVRLRRPHRAAQRSAPGRGDRRWLVRAAPPRRVLREDPWGRGWRSSCMRLHTFAVRVNRARTWRPLRGRWPSVPGSLARRPAGAAIGRLRFGGVPFPGSQCLRTGRTYVEMKCRAASGRTAAGSSGSVLLGGGGAATGSLGVARVIVRSNRPKHRHFGPAAEAPSTPNQTGSPC
jgi:hypothetical protein